MQPKKRTLQWTAKYTKTVLWHALCDTDFQGNIHSFELQCGCAVNRRRAESAKLFLFAWRISAPMIEGLQSGMWIGLHATCR